MLQTPYFALLENHTWHVPGHYNVAVDVCDRHDADKLAMIWADDTGTERLVYWGEPQDLSNQFANHYQAVGIERGDRVAVLLPTTPESAAAISSTQDRGDLRAPV